MKVALITDTHFGVRGSSRVFAQNQKEFYEKVFFPKIKELGIKHVWHLGDVFDKRKNIDFQTYKDAKDMFFEPARKMGLQIEEIIGNHDTYYRNTNKLNSPELLIEKEYSNINLITEKIEQKCIGGKMVDFVPWFHGTDHQEDTIEYIKNSKADILVGHLELSGFPMNPDVLNFHGLKPDIFDDYLMVLSGHFHTRSNKKNITYLGAPTQYDWGDYDDPRGFHVLDLKTLELEFIENPHIMFYKYVIEEDFDFSQIGPHLENKYVRLIQDDKCPTNIFDDAVQQFRYQSPHDLDIIERDELSLMTEGEGDIESVDIASTQSFIAESLKDADLTDEEKDEMIEFLNRLYLESLDE